MGIRLSNDIVRSEDSFRQLESLLSNKGQKEIDVVRIIETDDNLSGKQSSIISLYHFLDFLLINVREKYLTIDASIKGSETPEGRESILNSNTTYGREDAIISSTTKLKEQAMVAIMVNYLEKQGIRTNLKNPNGSNLKLERDAILQEAHQRGFEKKELMNYNTVQEYLKQAVTQAVHDTIFLKYR